MSSTEQGGGAVHTGETQGIYAQLLRQQERALQRLQDLKSELDAPTTRSLLKQLRQSAGTSIDQRIGQLLADVETALRTIQLCQAAIQRELHGSPDTWEAEGPANLPPHLRRFLAERKSSPGFRWEVLEDPMRGWVIRWKEYTIRGTVRGSGQFSERPYAWLDD